MSELENRHSHRISACRCYSHDISAKAKRDCFLRNQQRSRKIAGFHLQFHHLLNFSALILLAHYSHNIGLTTAKVGREPHCGIRRNSALAAHDLANAHRGDANILRQPVGADAERFHKVLFQDFAGKDRMHSFCHFSLLMIIHDVDVIRLEPLHAVTLEQGLRIGALKRWDHVQ